MGYYIRVLGTQDPNISLDELINALKLEGLSAKFSINEHEQPNSWTVIRVANSNGDALAQIEKNPVIEGELGKEELDEFAEEIEDEKPASAVKWLRAYFKKIKVIYAFQLLNAAFADDNFEIISTLKTFIWNRTEGILQADNEGFSNENGYHILWQFSESVTGEWCCAIRNSSDQWTNFKMDLGDLEQRKEFQGGKIPKKAVLL